MPVATSNYNIHTYSSVSSFPSELWATLDALPRDTNVIYPHALKCLAKEKAGEPTPAGQFWITCGLDESIDLILACTESAMGKYPVFIVPTALAPPQLTENYLLPRLHLLAEELLECVSPDRVYSVFAPDLVTLVFVHIWTELTGIECAKDPEYYAAKLTYCTRATFVNRSVTIHPDIAYDLRPAVTGDIPEVAQLCFGFAAESEPFVLSEADAVKEATLLVRQEQLWVHRVRIPGQPSEIASIVAISRSSERVATITKVYTNPRWRRRGCAERLVRRVCKHLLLTKDTVALYVAHNNPAAAKVYHRVGFAGLAANSPRVEGVDSWLELGLDRSRVRLGHW